MRRMLSLIAALVLAPTVASAQQPCSTNAQQVVDQIYRQLLSRPADPGSVAWAKLLTNREATVRDLVREIAKSPEYAQHFAPPVRGNRLAYDQAVGTLYQKLMGRPLDAESRREYAETASVNGLGAVVDDILSSTEYRRAYGDWEVPGSRRVSYCADGFVGGRSTSRQTDYDRFRAMDRNGDGIITRDEWRGSDQEFRDRDWNHDLVLSGDEARDDGFANRRSVGTSGQFVIVDSRERWTDTGIMVRAGDSIFFDATGSVQLSSDPSDVATPDGSRSNRRAPDAPLQQRSAGALVARIGNAPPVFVGTRGSIERAPASGRLYLTVNDDFLGDNSGQFRVTVDIESR